MNLIDFKRTAHAHLLIFVLLFSIILAPATVYAEEETAVLPTDGATVQPITGAAIPTDKLPVSLVENICTYLVDSFTAGIIDVDKYNQILNSGMVSEDAFFSNSVFVGDSITFGFWQYCDIHNDSIKTDTTYFLARGGCSAKVAISENALTKHSSIMPMLNGNVTYVEDAIAQMGIVNKVFICFGMNDLVRSTPEQFLADMQTLIIRILEKRPDVNIYVISIPCVMSNVSNGSLNNYTIQVSNILLQNMCQMYGWGYINITEYLMNDNMALRPEYTSDGAIHENDAAYTVWTRVLKNYAFGEIIK